MTKTTGLVLALAAMVVFPACGDDDDGNGNPDNPAFVSSFPDNGFINRTTTVALIGEDTAWSDASTVDFGAGITVNSVMAVGSTGLIVEISVAGDAAEGPRDVTVDGDTLTGGFTLAQPITVTVNGTLAQGSLLDITVTNNDPLNPFDTTTDEEGNPLLTVVTATAGVTTFAPGITGNEVNFLAGVGVNAPAGTLSYSMTSGQIVDTFSVDIAARAATALDLAAVVNGNLPAGSDSDLYELALPIDTAAQVSFPVNAGGNLIYLALDSTGSFDNILNLGFFGLTELSLVTAQAETFYIVVWDGTVDGSGAGDYTLAGISITPDAGNIITAAENGDTAGDAQAVTLPGLANTADFDGDDDEDWFSIVVGAGDVGQGLGVFTDGVSTADPVITVFEADGTTLVAQSDDAVFFDTLVTPALAEGTYLVQITDSTFGAVDPADSEYRVFFGFGAPGPAPAP